MLKLISNDIYEDLLMAPNVVTQDVYDFNTIP